MKNLILPKILLPLILCMLWGCSTDSPSGPDDNNAPKIDVAWQPTNGPDGGYINWIAFGPDEYVFAATKENGIFRSPDNGGTWQEVNNQIEFPDVGCIAVNAQGHLFAGGGLPAGTLYRSTDLGDNWQKLKERSFGLVAIHPNGEIYASFEEIGLCRSSDNGENWEATGLSGGYAALFFDDTKILIAGWDSLYISGDTGQTWTTTIRMFNTNSLVMDNNGHILAAGTSGIFRSVDKGVTWTKINDMYVLYMAINSAGDLFAATYSGLFRSTNRGSTWENIIDDQTRHVAINSDEHIYISTPSGVFCSTNNGMEWNMIGVPASRIIDLAADANIRVYAVDGSSVSMTENNGNIWHNQEHGDFGRLAVDSKGNVFTGGMNGLYKSTDHGATWSFVSDIEVNALAVNAQDHIFAAGWNSGIFRSTDNGATWQLKGPENIIVNDITVNSQGHIIVVGKDVHRSTDGGESFSVIGAANSYGFTSVVTDQNGYIYAGNLDGDLVYSKDGGQNWVQKNYGAFWIHCLAVDHNNYIYSGSELGVHVSTDSGENWVAVNEGFINRFTANISIRALAVNSDNSLFAACDGWGVFRGHVIPVPAK